MTKFSQTYILRKLNCIFLILSVAFICSCAELDGVFPRFEPNKKSEVKESLLNTESVKQRQSVLSEENAILQKKIDKLEKQIFDLEKKHKDQKKEILLLREQWEMNFVLLERSVEESLSSKKDFVIESQKSSKVYEKNTNKKKVRKKNNVLPVEDFSLMENTYNDSLKKGFENNDSIGLNSLDLEEENFQVIEEPGFQEIGKVNLNDIEEPVEFLETNSDILLTGTEPSESNQSSFKEKDYEINIFSDPDLNPPEEPLILIRHPGVKKIYNQGMTALIQKNHLQAISLFKNFTKRFPNNVDSDNAYYWIGRSYFELNELEKAELAFRKVLTLYEHRPTSQGYKTPDSIYMLGKLQFRKNIHKKAKYYWEEVIKRYPGSAAARNAMREIKE